MSLHFTPAGLPGYSLPLYYEPTYDIFPNALSPRHIEDGYFGRFDTYREMLMRQVMNSITDKPEWYRKVSIIVGDSVSISIEENRDIVQPEPGDFDPKKVTPKDSIKLCEKFPQGLQVIVKLSNIELTPEKPEYHGGTWHVEGALNEHICAPAIYYYDSKNITESSLAFRQRVLYDDVFDFLDYEQNYHEFLQIIFGMAQDVESRGDTRVTQNLGSISTHEGRLLTFPNMLQHCVSPFSIADTSKLGHRKILALFLVDPNYRSISSANVPPQSEEWWEEKRDAIFSVLPRRPPRELQDMVMENVDVGHITMNEACQYRLELMEERTAKTAEAKNDFEIGDFNLCEH